MFHTLLRLAQRYRLVFVVTVHACAAAISVVSALALRFDLAVPIEEVRRLRFLLPSMLVGRLLALWLLGVFRGSWRHFGMRDSIELAQATLLGTAAGMALLVLAEAMHGLPRSFLIIEPGLFFLVSGGIRLLPRVNHEHRTAASSGSRRRVLVIGADDAAERFIRQCQHDADSDLLPVGLVSIEPNRNRLAIHGVPLVGSIGQLPRLALKAKAKLIVIALSQASGLQMRGVVAACEQSGIEFKSMPTMRELLEGRARADDVRDILLDDLLGRRPVQLALDIVERDLSSTTVLVTGAAGSIGSELVRQVAGFGPKRLILVEQAESPLYFMQHELAKQFPALTVVPVIGDIVDTARLSRIFRDYRPDVVFHAAAYKHVPMMEHHPGEAIRNNVLGTLNVATAAVRNGARKFVLISTDKAVNPSSVMGTTKRLAELIVLGHPAVRGQGTDFRAVRFGNVLGSAGSVIPLFQRQLADGGPLTVTDPDVRRFFMTIPEAVELVLQAAALPEASDRITMLDMGEPVRIVELAEQLIRMSGKIPYRDVAITFTGLREGEKLNEDLMSLMESGTPTTVEQIRILKSDGVEGAQLQEGLYRLAAAAELDDSVAMIRLLKSLVPEYTPRIRDTEIPLQVAVEPARPGTRSGRGAARGADRARVDTYADVGDRVSRLAL